MNRTRPLDASFLLPMVFALWHAGGAQAQVAVAVDRASSGIFDAADTVGCVQDAGKPVGSCRASVARANGAAAVVVSFSNGFSRVLLFSDGAFLRGNATMSGSGTDIAWQVSDDTYYIRVDDQRYEIAQALVIGD